MLLAPRRSDELLTRGDPGRSAATARSWEETELMATQRDMMRQLFRDHWKVRKRAQQLDTSGIEDAVVNAYAAAERAGGVRRKSNMHGVKAEQYARALFRRGIAEGWIYDEPERGPGG